MHLHFWYKCFLFSPCTHSTWFLRQLLLLNRWKPSASTENNCRVRIGGLVALFWVKLRQLALFSLKYTAKGHSLWAEKTRAAGQVRWCSHSKHQPQSSAADLAVAAGFCNIPCIVCACWSVVDAFLSRKRKKDWEKSVSRIPMSSAARTSYLFSSSAFVGAKAPNHLPTYSTWPKD